MFCISACLAAKISIHALRVEGDDAYHTATRCCRNFYPRPPGGGRPAIRAAIPAIAEFLSTPSGWRATYNADRMGLTTDISIHALRVEGDEDTALCQIRYI